MSLRNGNHTSVIKKWSWKEENEMSNFSVIIM